MLTSLALFARSGHQYVKDTALESGISLHDYMLSSATLSYNQRVRLLFSPPSGLRFLGPFTAADRRGRSFSKGYALPSGPTVTLIDHRYAVSHIPVKALRHGLSTSPFNPCSTPVCDFFRRAELLRDDETLEDIQLSNVFSAPCAFVYSALFQPGDAVAVRRLRTTDADGDDCVEQYGTIVIFYEISLTTKSGGVGFLSFALISITYLYLVELSASILSFYLLTLGIGQHKTFKLVHVKLRKQPPPAALAVAPWPTIRPGADHTPFVCLAEHIVARVFFGLPISKDAKFLPENMSKIRKLVRVLAFPWALGNKLGLNPLFDPDPRADEAASDPSVASEADLSVES